ncbi:hypothetical protein AB0M29_29160 [Streptomyces sp. NPDC051976]|uniref:hypothetical protein n=1 Tax=Streptomyces sp. NPDC051976 TaxID=3154947 RepID=UPI003448137F
MPRRVSLPGADELFRTTGGAALQAPQPRQHPGGEAQNGTAQGERLRPVPESETQDDEAAARPATEAPGDRTEHNGRDIPPNRRPLTADRTVERTGERVGAPGGGQVPSQGQPAQDRTAVTTAPQQQGPPPVQPPITAQPQPQAARRKAPRPSRRPSGRERHDEKITVYVSAEELMDLEHARLVLRGEHGLAIDRGRIVREAVAVVLADLESRGDASILVRRLRGR